MDSIVPERIYYACSCCLVCILKGSNGTLIDFINYILYSTKEIPFVSLQRVVTSRLCVCELDNVSSFRGKIAESFKIDSINSTLSHYEHRLECSNYSSFSQPKFSNSTTKDANFCTNSSLTKHFL